MFVCFDIETTGLSPTNDRIIEIGAVKIIDGVMVDKFSSLINPEIYLPRQIVELTGISDDMLLEAPTIEEVLPSFIDFVGDLPLMGHNINFDYSFIKENATKLKIPFQKNGIDTLYIARNVLTDLHSRSLASLCHYYGIRNMDAHRAYSDALATSILYNKMKEQYYENHSDLFTAKVLHYKPKKDQPITIKQKNYLIDLIYKHKLDIDYEIEELSKSEASRKIDKIILQYGRGY